MNAKQRRKAQRRNTIVVAHIDSDRGVITVRSLRDKHRIRNKDNVLSSATAETLFEFEVGALP